LLENALVNSKMDYCNAVYSSLTDITHKIRNPLIFWGAKWPAEIRVKLKTKRFSRVLGFKKRFKQVNLSLPFLNGGDVLLQHVEGVWRLLAADFGGILVHADLGVIRIKMMADIWESIN
jgi:hypothetical protein